MFLPTLEITTFEVSPGITSALPSKPFSPHKASILKIEHFLTIGWNFLALLFRPIRIEPHFHKRRLKMNGAETVSTFFYSANQLANDDLQTTSGIENIKSGTHFVYQQVTLDRTLTYTDQLEMLKKMRGRINLIPMILRPIGVLFTNFDNYTTGCGVFNSGVRSPFGFTVTTSPNSIEI